MVGGGILRNMDSPACCAGTVPSSSTLNVSATHPVELQPFGPLLSPITINTDKKKKKNLICLCAFDASKLFETYTIKKKRILYF